MTFPVINSDFLKSGEDEISPETEFPTPDSNPAAEFTAAPCTLPPVTLTISSKANFTIMNFAN
jgi:hypothetical protein